MRGIPDGGSCRGWRRRKCRRQRPRSSCRTESGPLRRKAQPSPAAERDGIAAGPFGESIMIIRCAMQRNDAFLLSPIDPLFVCWISRSLPPLKRPALRLCFRPAGGMERRERVDGRQNEIEAPYGCGRERGKELPGRPVSSPIIPRRVRSSGHHHLRRRRLRDLLGLAG